MKRSYSEAVRNEQSSEQLPIHQYKSKLIETIKSHATTILVGETGSGSLILEHVV